VQEDRRVRARLTAGSLLLVTLGAACAPAASSPQGRAEPAARGAAAEVWAVGDADVTRAGRRLAATVRAARPERLLYLGDVYETGTAREFRTRYDPLYGSLARRTLPTPGNHEWGNRDVGYRPYWRARLGRPVPDWQQRRIGGWEVLVLNSQVPAGRGSAQLAWARRAASEPGTCRIAIFHRPRFSTGWHGDQRDLDPLWRALGGRARVVLSGHDHDLQRFADRDGLRQYVVGAGGRPNLPLPRRSAARVRYVNRFEPGAARLRLRPGRATIDLVAAGGRVLDRSSVTCRPLGR
jgi:3',5'-cyclic AMP phosphodiesterase CpdA